MATRILGIPIKTDRIPAAARSRLLRSPAAWFAAGLGAGFSPFAPGTAGSLVGLVAYLPLARLSPIAALSAVVAVMLAGVLASNRAVALVGLKDPSVVVIDEVAGMWVTLLALPPAFSTFALGFFFFRVMDVVKPWPARRLEALPSGWGIMADDVMAGIYANLVLRLLSLWLPL